MAYDYKKIGERIRNRRKEIGITDARSMIEEIKDAGYKQGIGYNKYLDIENGLSCDLDLKLIEVISKILQCDTDYLLCKTDYITNEEKIAGDLLGLSPSSIRYLHSNRHNIDTGTLDYLLTNHYGDFSYFLLCFTNCLSSFNRINAAAIKFGGKLDKTEIDSIQEEEKTTSDAALLEMLHTLQLIRDTAIYDTYTDNKIKHKLLYEQLANEEE